MVIVALVLAIVGCGLALLSLYLNAQVQKESMSAEVKADIAQLKTDVGTILSHTTATTTAKS